MGRCIVPGCNTVVNADQRTTPPISLHAWPTDEELSNRWQKAINRPNWKPSKHSRICSKHFKDEDLDRNSPFFVKLKKGVVPSIFEKFQEYEDWDESSEMKVDCGVDEDLLINAEDIKEEPNVDLGDQGNSIIEEVCIIEPKDSTDAAAPLPTSIRLVEVPQDVNVKKCIVPTCTSEYSEAPFFSFPKDKGLCLKWLLAIPKGSWTLNEESVVCSRHFNKQTAMVNGGTSLTASAVPELFLESPLFSSQASLSFTSCDDDGAVQPDSVADDKENSSDFGIAQETEDVCKIQLDADDGSGSDLEIIEPEIETYDVSDTSDEGETIPRRSTVDLKLDVQQSSSVTPNTVNLKSRGNQVIRSARIKCCVPRCGSVTGNPVGVGFHSFPQVGETRLSVKAIDSKVTIHDLFAMWKSLLSVQVIKDDSFVCTRHFTANDYSGSVLNKAAVPTQFLPTPVMFAPCRISQEMTVTPLLPPPLRMLPNIRNTRPPQNEPRVLQRKFPLSVMRHQQSVASRDVRAQGPLHQIPILRKTYNKSRQISPLPSSSNHKGQTQVFKINGSVVLKKAHIPSSMPCGANKPISKICSIRNCPNANENAKATLFKLPKVIEKCKEWVYACGHPEWLDRGMASAQLCVRICSSHFADNMFIDVGKRLLKGSAKPVINVPEPYKKCAVHTCHNYFDKERLHHIGVDFALFPNEPELLKPWIIAVKNTKGAPIETIEVTDEDISNYNGAVICSLHFRNSDYVQGAKGKTLHSSSVPSMNLVDVEPKPLLPDDNSDNETQNSPVVPPAIYGLRGRRRRGRGRKLVDHRRSGYRRKQILEARDPDETAMSGESVVDFSTPHLPTPKRGRPFGRRRGRLGRPRGRRGQLNRSLPEPSTDDESNQDTESSTPTEVLYGRSGRPLRGAVLKRKSIVESGSESNGINSDEDIEVKRRPGRPKKYPKGEEFDSPFVGLRARSTREAALKSRARLDAMEIDDDDERDHDAQDEWQLKESETFGSSHFLDPVLDNLESSIQTEVNEDPPQPAQTDVLDEGNGTKSDDNGMECDVEGKKNVDDELKSDEADEEMTELTSIGDLVECQLVDTEDKPDEEENAESPLPKLDVPTSENVSSSGEVDIDDECQLVDANNKPDEEEKANSELPKSDAPSSENVSQVSGEGDPPCLSDKSEDMPNENEDVEFGPKLPKPTLADLEFFRSILPTVASFNQFQKAALRATVISQLKELLNLEDIGFEFNNELSV